MSHLLAPILERFLTPLQAPEKIHKPCSLTESLAPPEGPTPTAYTKNTQDYSILSAGKKNRWHQDIQN